MEITENTVAIVTGGASGLGAATVKALASRGAKVSIFDMNRHLGEEISHTNQADYYDIDVSKAQAVAEAVNSVESKFQRLNVLVNCAGIGPPAKTVSRGEPHEAALFAKVIEVNLIGSFHCASNAAAAMLRSDTCTDDGGRGVIINTASVAAYEGQIGQVAYAASKGGIVGMTLPMARDLSEHGVRVCTIAPGLFLTPLLESLPADTKTSLGQQVPFPARLGDPTEFAKMVCHIIDNEMLNGEIIRLDGAIRMSPR
tara:strand:+ start:155 stop:922 length:768 start_codon:yes stop_codon:yes gene_type:complete